MTMSPEITYVFKNGKTYAIHHGKVVAASTDSDDVQRQVKLAFGMDPMTQGAPQGAPHGGGPTELPPPPDELGGAGGFGQICPDCGAPDDGSQPVCPHCGAPLGQDLGHPGLEHGGLGPHDEPHPGHELGGEAGPMLASVVTPNGLRGTVMGKVATTWGDEVTIRLENGRIVHLPVGTRLRAEKTAAAPKADPIERLEARLARSYDGTRDSLVARSQELGHIKRIASDLIRGDVSYDDSIRLDKLVITSDMEQSEIADAVTHLDDVDSYSPPSFSMGAAADTAGISREDASWLDHTYNEMIAEAEATDYTKLMDEGPEAFTAELPHSALADTGVTRQMASSFVAEKTAGVDRKIADPYTETFLARVEECRRNELSSRTKQIKKEAAAQEDRFKDLPDDALFL